MDSKGIDLPSLKMLPRDVSSRRRVMRHWYLPTSSFEILNLYEIPQEVVNAIKVLYTDTKAKVLTSDGDTDTFDTVSGILQGDTLALFLFAIVLDSLDARFKKGLLIYPRRSRRHLSVHVTDLDFSADDLAITSETVQNAERRNSFMLSRRQLLMFTCTGYIQGRLRIPHVPVMMHQ